MKNKFLLTLALLAGIFGSVPAFADVTPEQFRKLKIAAEQGDADAQFRLGTCYSFGEGTEKDSDEAVKWYRKAAEQGNAKAQYNLGVCYENTNPEESLKLYHKAAIQGLADAQFRLGYSYMVPRFGGKRNPREAFLWLRKAVKKGVDPWGKSWEGMFSSPELVEFYERNAKRGGSISKVQLGVCYMNGWGSVEKDFSKAISWFQKAADQGGAFPMEQYYLAVCYAIGGFKVEQDLNKADHHLGKFIGVGVPGWEFKISEMDLSIPENSRIANDTFVCIIANEDYSKVNVENVQFAENDGKVFADYARKTLGVPEENIKLIVNATAGAMRGAEAWLDRHTKNASNPKIIYYYAGHGVPIIKKGKIEQTCILPTDVLVEDAEFAGIDVQKMLGRLGKLNVKQVAVFLDACFSGMTRDDKPQFTARGVRLKVHPNTPQGNMVVFSAASGDQSALSCNEHYHGIFTKNLLLALQKTKGDISYKDLANSLKNSVSADALKLHNREQTPTVEVSGDFDMNQKLVE